MNRIMQGVMGVALATVGLAPWAPVFAQAASLQDLAKAADAAGSRPELIIYTAREIVTLDPARPTAQAVSVRGNRIVGVGSLDELKKAAGNDVYSVNATFANEVVVPGMIAQHDHPLLAALTMTSNIIAIEDWVLPQGTSKAAKNHEEYLQRVAQGPERGPGDLGLPPVLPRAAQEGRAGCDQLDPADHHLAPLGARVLPELGG
jgi:hypothetical protein